MTPPGLYLLTTSAGVRTPGPYFASLLAACASVTLFASWPKTSTTKSWPTFSSTVMWRSMLMILPRYGASSEIPGPLTLCSEALGPAVSATAEGGATDSAAPAVKAAATVRRLSRRCTSNLLMTRTTGTGICPGSVPLNRKEVPRSRADMEEASVRLCVAPSHHQRCVQASGRLTPRAGGVTMGRADGLARWCGSGRGCGDCAAAAPRHESRSAGRDLPQRGRAHHGGRAAAGRG